MAEISMSEASLKIPIEMPTLYQVSLEGDVLGLKRLLQEDKLVLDRLSAITSFSETPLHIAAMRGHFDFARALLRYKPQLAGESDSFLRLPLHWAAEKGYTNIVRELLQKSPDHACFSHDQDGRIALHLAAMKERNDVVKELIRTRPESIREKVENGGTILHSCVKYNRLEALKLLLDTTQGHELVNEKDDHGNTILHLAAIFKQVEITKYLVSKSINIDTNALNTNDFTALDAIEHSPLDSQAPEIKNNILLEAGIQKKTNNPPSVLLHPTSSESIILKGCLSVARKCKKLWNIYISNFGKRLKEAHGSILIAATVTASLAFQAGMNPPDFAKLEAPDKTVDIVHDKYDLGFFKPFVLGKYGFWFYNTLSLVSSLVIILSMISGIPFRNKLSRLLLVFVMTAVVSNISVAYLLAAASNFSEKNNQQEDYQYAVRALLLAYYLLGVMYCLIIYIHVFNLALSVVVMILKFVKFIVWLIAKMLCCVHNKRREQLI